MINQYEIVLVNLDPAVGGEIKKTRACVVISPEESNHNLLTVVIAPMTSTSGKYPSRIEVKQNESISWIAIDQIRTIDKTRIIKLLGKLSSFEIKNVKSVIKETYVD